MPEPGLLGGAEIRRLAAELDLHPTKQRGQNFVTDPNTISRIVAAAEVRPEDVVLEIGPGLGSLTLGLLQRAAFVTAVEIDERLADQLTPTVERRLGAPAAQRLRVVAADALKVTSLPGPAPTIVVANLPYNVSVPVILHLLERFEHWDRGLVLVQTEVAERLVAGPGSRIYGAPSVKLAWYAAATRAGVVGRNVFWPVPNVESSLVAIRRRPAPNTPARRQSVFKVVDMAFASRRKMLRAALAGVVGSSESAAQAITAAGVDPTSRGESLSVEQFAAIARQLEVLSVL